MVFIAIESWYKAFIQPTGWLFICALWKKLIILRWGGDKSDVEFLHREMLCCYQGFFRGCSFKLR